VVLHGDVRQLAPHLRYDGRNYLPPLARSSCEGRRRPRTRRVRRSTRAGPGGDPDEPEPGEDARLSGGVHVEDTLVVVP
jgi:hypothetical protein